MNQQAIEFVYYISPDGVQYPLFGGKRALMSFSGLGMADVRYIQDSGPFTHGVRIRDFRLNERVIDLRLYERSCSRQTRWDNLGNLVDTVRMNRGCAGRLLVILPDSTEREIDAWILEGPQGIWDGQGALLPWDINEVLRFIAPYPAWRDTTEKEITFTITIVNSCLPNCLPFCVGGSSITANTSITYPGTWLAYPTIKFTGPISAPSVTNETTGRTIALNYNIALGEAVTIALDPNQATVENNAGDDLIGTVTNLNDLGTFAIEPEGVSIPGGVNVLSGSGSGGTAGITAIEISYYDHYLGVPK